VVERYTKDLRRAAEIIAAAEGPTTFSEKPTPVRLFAPGSPK
jgi:hypothetical protein